MNATQAFSSAIILSLAMMAQGIPASAAPAPVKTHAPTRTTSSSHGTVYGGSQRSFGGNHQTGGNGWKAPGAGGSHAPVGSNGWKAPSTIHHTPSNVNRQGINHGRVDDRRGFNDRRDVHGDRRIFNPHHYGAWGWHHGVAWAPDQSYWGGGFWGPLALGIVIGASVHVADGSPGRTLLGNYSLVQEQCDSNNDQVELYGPDGSVICAIPNSLVGPGRYDIDNSTLSLAPTTAE